MSETFSIPNFLPIRRDLCIFLGKIAFFGKKINFGNGPFVKGGGGYPIINFIALTFWKNLPRPLSLEAGWVVPPQRTHCVTRVFETLPYNNCHEFLMPHIANPASRILALCSHVCCLSVCVTSYLLSTIWYIKPYKTTYFLKAYDQRQCSQVSQVQVHKFKYTNTQIRKYSLDQCCSYA